MTAYPASSYLAGDAAVNAGWPYSPSSRAESGENTFLVLEDAQAQHGQRLTDPELRGALSVDDIHAAQPGAL